MVFANALDLVSTTGLTLDEIPENLREAAPMLRFPILNVVTFNEEGVITSPVVHDV
jgi:hypothetical protein